MLTNFGKECRKIRMDADELLATMAEKLRVSPSFLSAVEHGKKSIPKNWPETISGLYSLSKRDAAALNGAARQSQSNIKIELSALNDDSKELAISFARNLENLNRSDRDRIQEILSRK